MRPSASSDSVARTLERPKSQIFKSQFLFTSAKDEATKPGEKRTNPRKGPRTGRAGKPGKAKGSEKSGCLEVGPFVFLLRVGSFSVNNLGRFEASAFHMICHMRKPLMSALLWRRGGSRMGPFLRFRSMRNPHQMPEGHTSRFEGLMSRCLRFGVI